MWMADHVVVAELRRVVQDAGLPLRVLRQQRRVVRIGHADLQPLMDVVS